MEKYKPANYQLFKDSISEEMIYELKSQKELLENNAINHYWSGLGIVNNLEDVRSNAQNVLELARIESENSQ